MIKPAAIKPSSGPVARRLQAEIDELRRQLDERTMVPAPIPPAPIKGAAFVPGTSVPLDSGLDLTPRSNTHSYTAPTGDARPQPDVRRQPMWELRDGSMYFANRPGEMQQRSTENVITDPLGRASRTVPGA